MMHGTHERQCKLCDTVVKRRKSTRFADLPEEDGFTWCSDKCLMIWLFVHQVKQNGEEITEIHDNEKGTSFSISDLTPEDIEKYL